GTRSHQAPQLRQRCRLASLIVASGSTTPGKPKSSSSSERTYQRRAQGQDMTRLPATPALASGDAAPGDRREPLTRGRRQSSGPGYVVATSSRQPWRQDNRWTPGARGG